MTTAWTVPPQGQVLSTSADFELAKEKQTALAIAWDARERRR
jgi:hypothetical protein